MVEPSVMQAVAGAASNKETLAARRHVQVWAEVCVHASATNNNRWQMLQGLYLVQVVQDAGVKAVRFYTVQY